MPIDTTTILYVTLFAGTLLFIEGIYFLVVDWRDKGSGAINRRLRLSESGEDPRYVLRKMRREDQGPLSAALARMFPTVDQLIYQSGMQLSFARLVVMVVALFVGVFSVLRIATALPTVYLVIMALMIAVLLPAAVLNLKRRARMKRFGRQLPEALDLLVRSIRAGHPVSTAVSLVARELPDPIGSEFGITLDEMTYGLDITEALDNLFKRVPHPDLHFFIVSVQIQHNTGGNLAEVLSNLSKIIRDRFRMFEKIGAVSAEGRASGVVIGAMPFFVFAVVNLLSPGYFGEVRGDPLFFPLLAVAGVLLVIGQYMIWKMVNFKF